MPSIGVVAENSVDVAAQQWLMLDSGIEWVPIPPGRKIHLKALKVKVKTKVNAVVQVTEHSHCCTKYVLLQAPSNRHIYMSPSTTSYTLTP